MLPSTNDFGRVLAAEGISNFGSMLSRLALPWLATLVLLATPLQMALLLVADVAAGAIGSLLLGPLVDRTSKRTTMIVADLARAAVLALLAASVFAGSLSMLLLVTGAALTGLLTMAFELARSAWVAQSVAADRLPARNAQLSAVGSVSETGAFAAGGWLYQLLGAALALAVDAASYLLSAACLWRLHEDPRTNRSGEDAEPTRPATSPGARFIDDLRAGLAVIRTTPALRVLATLEVLLAIGGSVAATSYMIFVARDLGFGTGALGMIFAIGGLGAIAGAALAPRLARRFGCANAMTAGLILLALGALCIPLAAGATLAGAAFLVVHQLVGDGGATIFHVHDRTLRQTAVAPDLLARADGGLRMLGQLATLVGALGGGWLATGLGARFALYVVAGMFALAALVAHHRLRDQR